MRLNESNYVVVDGRTLLRVRGGDDTPPEEQRSLLELLDEQRNTERNELADLIEARQTVRDEFETRSAEGAENPPTDEERRAFVEAEREFSDDLNNRREGLATLEQRIAEQTIIEERRQAAAAAGRGTLQVTGEPRTYRSDNAREISYFRDLACVSLPSVAARMADPNGAEQRLLRHAKELAEDLPRRDAARERRAQEAIDNAERQFRGSFIPGLVQQRGLEETPFERRTNPNRTDGQGGYFVPPLWLIDEYIPALRAKRVAAGLCRQMDLPEGTDSINIPKLSTTTKVDMQAELGAVSSQDLTDTTVSAGVVTAAGQEDISIQLLEQSGASRIIDQVVIEDLMADYNRLVDRQVISGTGSGSNQVLGILPSTNWSGTNTVTWTSASPLGPSYNMALGALASKVAYNRFNLDNFAFLGHPRRWFWFATSLDGASGTSGRPIVSRDGFGQFNASAMLAGDVPHEGLAGEVPFGPRYYIDANVPAVATAGGAVSGGTSDLSLGALWDDLWLFEGSLRTRVLSEVLSGTLEVRFQVYNYLAFLARYGQSIAVVAGTGMAAPTGAIDTSITF